MSILFDKIIFGAIKSRRFGLSLGVNLLPLTNKICNFNCIYCECGWTDLKAVEEKFHPKNQILEAVEVGFKEFATKSEKLDNITFAGNGEPTMHPEFSEIIDKVIALRNCYLPEVKIVVLSNSALLGNMNVIEALKKVDQCVLKLDAGTDDLFRKINKPLSNKKIDWYVQKLKEFSGDLTIQTIFLRGIVEGEYIDNTTESEVESWVKILQEINPKLVMIYTIDRETPAKDLEKVSIEELETIADKVNKTGIAAHVYS